MLFSYRRRRPKTIVRKENDKRQSRNATQEILNLHTEKTIKRIDQFYEISFAKQLHRHIGETVTVFVIGGGMSGSGFTGVLLSANDTYLRLIIRIGPAPACSLGNTCDLSFRMDISNYYYPPFLSLSTAHSSTEGGINHPVYTVGSVADILISGIAAFVHNAV